MTNSELAEKMLKAVQTVASLNDLQPKQHAVQLVAALCAVALAIARAANRNIEGFMVGLDDDGVGVNIFIHRAGDDELYDLGDLQ